MKRRPSFLGLLLPYVGIPIAVVAVLLIWKTGSGDRADRLPAAAPEVARQPAKAEAVSREGAPTAAELQAASKTFETFQRRPFAVAQESGVHEWTAEDGRSPDVILEIAHNELEVRRLMEESERIKRRQVIYRKEPVFVLVERARATGESVRGFKLPAFDGQELEVEVTSADLAPSGLNGTFTGILPGRRQSLVTLAFQQGREAFTVVSPEDGIFLQGHPREPGEIILTSFDPETYLPLPGGEPIRTNEPVKIAE